MSLTQARLSSCPLKFFSKRQKSIILEILFPLPDSTGRGLLELVRVDPRILVFTVAYPPVSARVRVAFA